MRITKFWAKGYRSLRDVTLDHLGPHVVFYGENGSGKSNLLAAIDALFRCVEVLNSETHAILLNVQRHQSQDLIPYRRSAGDAIYARGGLGSRDFTAANESRALTIGATLALEEGSRSLTLEIVADEVIPGQPRLALSQLSLDGVSAPNLFPIFPDGIDGVRRWLVRVCAGFAVVAADRAPRFEVAIAPPQNVTDIVAWHLREGRLKSALFAASTSTDASLRKRFRALRVLLEGEPLRRPPFDVVQDPRTQQLDLREPLGDSDVSLDLAGLGVTQAYALLSGVMLSGADAVAIEEPEAHLHAPTMGFHVRTLLARTVAEGHTKQLFLATHSNLFDLDPTGYWDVSLRDGATRVERRRLDEIDARHLYEPGPAKHILQRMLQRYGDEFVFRDGSGKRFSASEMIAALQNDEPVALDFLRTMHATALETMAMRAQDEPEVAP